MDCCTLLSVLNLCMWCPIRKRTYKGTYLFCRNDTISLLVTTGDGKFYSNGLDLDWLSQLNEVQHHEMFNVLLPSLLWRLLTFPMPTIAAVNGTLLVIRLQTYCTLP